MSLASSFRKLCPRSRVLGVGRVLGTGTQTPGAQGSLVGHLPSWSSAVFLRHSGATRSEDLKIPAA